MVKNFVQGHLSHPVKICYRNGDGAANACSAMTVNDVTTPYEPIHQEDSICQLASLFRITEVFDRHMYINNTKMGILVPQVFESDLTAMLFYINKFLAIKDCGAMRIITNATHIVPGSRACSNHDIFDYCVPFQILAISAITRVSRL
mmetsp:Transcript_41505/g.67364  ORF Transcript_41505/g.67364 Transcript_41505/m.67364 type:complete len:147 (-) Transcript_41505:527-967(-)